MKFGTLKSIGHNIASSLASGIGLMIGVYDMDVFGEASSGPEGFIEVDFLTGLAFGSPASAKLRQAIQLYAQALPDLCKSHGADASDFSELTARFSGAQRSERFRVTVADRHGKRSIDNYIGVPGTRPKILDHLGRVRGT